MVPITLLPVFNRTLVGLTNGLFRFKNVPHQRPSNILHQIPPQRVHKSIGQSHFLIGGFIRSLKFVNYDRFVLSVLCQVWTSALINILFFSQPSLNFG